MLNKAIFASLATITCSAYYVHSHSFATAESKGTKVNPFSDKEWRKFKLREIQDVNRNSKIFKFQLPEQDKNSKLDLPVASCITTKCFDEKEKKTLQDLILLSAPPLLVNFIFW